MINVDDVKKRMISFLESNGPSLPITLSSYVKLEPVFTSAILSELSSLHKVELSNMRVGSSRIYYLKGQEEGLEKFADEHLSGIVKQSYNLLKENKFLADEEQEPAVRVALRSLKDFAIPFQYGEKVMWRYAFTPKEDILKLIEAPKKVEEVSERKRDVKEEKEVEREVLTSEASGVEEKSEESDGESLDEVREEVREVKKEGVEQKPLFHEPFEKGNDKSSESEKKDKVVRFELTEEVKDYLNSKNLTLVEEIEETKNEFSGVISVKTAIGQMNFLLIAKNRKSINDSDILAIKQKSIEQSMPCYFLHKGKLTKRGEEVLEQSKNLIKIDKID